MVLVNREFHGKLPEPHYKGFNEALTKLLDTVRERILDFRQLVLILRFVILHAVSVWAPDEVTARERAPLLANSRSVRASSYP